MALDLGKLLEFSFNCFKDGKTRKLFFIVLALNIVMALIGYYLMLPYSDLSKTGTGLAGFFGALMLSLIAVIAIGLLSMFLAVKMQLIALKKLGFKLIELNAGKFVELVLLYFAGFIASMLSLFRVKFLAVLAAGIVLLAAGFMLANGLLGALGALLLVAYVVVWMYNSLRLAFGAAFFLGKGKGIMQSLKASDESTKGKLVELFIALVVIGFIGVIIGGLADFIGSGLASASGLEVLGQVISTAGSALMAPVYAFYFMGLFKQLIK
ncbi:hypothetical protein HZB89_01895 [archaeon]|nr:hypothetical protein [archaeon]